MKKSSAKTTGSTASGRAMRGKQRDDALFPAAPSHTGLPASYGEMLAEIKHRIRDARLKTVMAANTAMVMLYWEVGQLILERQGQEGWGARVIDRLSADLRQAYPETSGLSPRNLKYMRAFAAAWPDPAIVQQLAAQLPWTHNCVLLDRCADAAIRAWYVRACIEHGWSRNILQLQVDAFAHERQGKAVTNFNATLPPAESDMAAQIFKDPYLFDFLGTADPRREREVEQALVDHTFTTR